MTTRVCPANGTMVTWSAGVTTMSVTLPAGAIFTYNEDGGSPTAETVLGLETNGWEEVPSPEEEPYP